ncbi:MAG: GntR family transcriptional regulator [Candidatus Binatia bacterium]
MTRSEAQQHGAQPLIADILRDAIRQRLLPPGMALVQGALAEALGVSRVPVREALHSLAAEGLVVFAEDGAHVAVLEPGEIHELWSLRALIEPAMAVAIAQHTGAPELALLSRLVERMDAAEGSDAWSDLNFAFHLELYRTARLPHYAATARRILTQIEPYSRVAVSRLQGQGAAQAEHHEMITALERRDGEALREVLERHSIRARALLVGYAEKLPDDAAPSQQTADAARAFAARLFAPA